MINHFLIIFTTAAVCMDLNRQKIDNRWIGFGWLAGFIYQLFRFQVKGAGLFFLGALVPIILLYVLFWFRMLGAGDIKLLSVLGGFMGPLPVLYCICFSFLFGAALSIAVLVLCGNLRERLRYFIRYIRRFLKTKQPVPYRKKGHRMEHIHFSVPVLMGVLLFAGGVY